MTGEQVRHELLFAEPAPPGEDGGGVYLGCDCGRVTHLILAGELDGPVEASVTCRGCGTTYWFTVTPGHG